MQRTVGYKLLFFILCLSWSSCSDGDNSPDREGRDELVPLELRAENESLTANGTRAATFEAFSTTLFSSLEKGVYASFGGEHTWQRDAEVATSGAVTFTGELPLYPSTGDWLYLTAVSPSVAPTAVANGSVTATIDGKTDLLHAAEIRGNRWDGDRFAGNTDETKDKPLSYSHLLTQVKFCAKKKEQEGITVKVTRVTVKQTNTSATIQLNNGNTAFSTPRDLALEIAGEGVEINTQTSSDLGSLLIAPLEAGTEPYVFDIETSAGNYTNIRPSFTEENLYRKGYSHTITFIIGDHEVAIEKVEVSDWMPVVVNGDMELVQ